MNNNKMNIGLLIVYCAVGNNCLNLIQFNCVSSKMSISFVTAQIEQSNNFVPH
jgi:hypothetical protein